jgi:hypothetical protein
LSSNASRTIALQSKELVQGQSIELDSRTIVLFSKDRTPAPDPDLALSFSVPIPPDAPQCIHTHKATISHKLTATLHTINRPPLHKTITVHTRRFSQRSAPLPVMPEEYYITDPTEIQVQLPRRTFYAGEIIPLYITVPPIDRSVLERKDLVLRNITAELRRTVAVAISRIATPNRNSIIQDQSPSTSSISNEKAVLGNPSPSYSRGAESELRNNTLARSGAACRFHDTKAIRLRLLLHLPPAEPQIGPSSSAGEYQGEHSDCGFITQATLLHSVSFHLVIQAQFIKTPTPHQNSFSISVPVTILPPQAAATEVDISLDAAYAKKHDRPPAKTTRHPQAESTHTSAHDYASAGPSGDPPPFEDPDPPPFSVSDPQTENQLPSFVESQADLGDLSSLSLDPEDPQLEDRTRRASGEIGEGVLFGFAASEQFDGMGSDSTRSDAGPSFRRPINTNEIPSDPPPHITAPAMESEGSLMLSPPPPPVMDDPLDPPPTIDVGYLTMPNSTEVVQDQPPPAPSPTTPSQLSAHDPPPYATPSTRNEQSTVVNPPPYV